MTSPKRALRILFPLTIALVVLLFGGGALYENAGGESCARCHEIRPAVQTWEASSHRSVPCQGCHGGVLTLDAGSQTSVVDRIVRQVKGDVPRQIRLKHWRDIERTTLRCRQCHRREYAGWRAGLHSATYGDLFLNPEHNSEELLENDCLRCHGMYFQGGIDDLVRPVNTTGPWKLKVPALRDQPAIPCLSCHAIHRPGRPLVPRVQEPAQPAAEQGLFLPSLTLFDRRARATLSLPDMPMPKVLEGERAVKMSPDHRQAICYRCHAPLAGAQAGSGDDRTPLGVHEGISCLACHDQHTQRTRASCAECHPEMSNCGRDVETMDTTFKNLDSAHNIHTVKCADCHPKGVPPTGS